MNYQEIKSREDAFQKARQEWLLGVDNAIRWAKAICLFSAISFLLLFILFSCSKEKEDCNCEGLFVNVKTAEYIHQPTDCDRVPPDGYVFVKCVEPKY